MVYKPGWPTCVVVHHVNSVLCAPQQRPILLRCITVYVCVSSCGRGPLMPRPLWPVRVRHLTLKAITRSHNYLSTNSIILMSYCTQQQHTPINSIHKFPLFRLLFSVFTRTLVISVCLLARNARLSARILVLCETSIPIVDTWVTISVSPRSRTRDMRRYLRGVPW